MESDELNGRRMRRMPGLPRPEQTPAEAHDSSGRWRATILHTHVDVLSGNDVLNRLLHSEILPNHVCYVNAHSLNLAFADTPYRDVLSRAQLVLNDGIGVDLAGRMRGVRFVENLNGSDFTVRLLTFAVQQGWKVFLYGGRPGVASTAATVLTAQLPGLLVVGAQDGYTGGSDAEVVERIRSSGADVLIAALGQPKQELWLDAHLPATGCHVGVGVGAFLDFVSGRVVRAPQWMNSLGMEWLFRLSREPSRLWRRYILGNPIFLWRAWRLRSTESGVRCA